MDAYYALMAMFGQLAVVYYLGYVVEWAVSKVRFDRLFAILTIGQWDIEEILAAKGIKLPHR
jgi:hypothetical protein